MEEKEITRICFVITFVGLFLFAIFYENEFNEKTITEMSQEMGAKGIVTGRVSVIIREEPLIFVLQNERSIKVFHSRKKDIRIGEIVEVFAETQEYNNEIQLFAYRIVRR